LKFDGRDCHVVMVYADETYGIHADRKSNTGTVLKLGRAFICG